MNGIHDLGGMHGFGQIERDEDEPLFHDDWERRVFGLLLAALEQRLFNVDEQRHSTERMAPHAYLRASYYQTWLDGMERLLVEKGILTQGELDRRIALLSERPEAEFARSPGAAGEANRTEATESWTDCRREAQAPAMFKQGDAVVTRNFHPHGHTRLPRYARGKLGQIERVHDVFIFPDAHAHALGEAPQWVYATRFDGEELWGDSAEAQQAVFLDLWESYLLPA